MATALIYDFLLILMTLILFFSGWLISKKILPYWQGATFGILAYSLNVGLRFGRGVDYNLYVDIFNSIVYGSDSDHEILFQYTIKLLGMLGGTWPVFVFLMSLFFIFSVYFFLQNYRPFVLYILPIFPYFTMFSENIVRQTMGLSFLLIGLYFLIKKEKNIILYGLFSALGVLCHSVTLVFVFLFYILSLPKDAMLSPKYSILLFFIFVLFFRSESIMVFMTLFTSLMIGDHYAQYAENADMWLQKGFDDGVSYTVTALYVFVAFYGYKIRSFFGRKYAFAYNVFLVGFLLYPISVKIELLSRIGVVLEMFIFVIMGCMFFYFISFKRMWSHIWAFVILSLFSLNLLRVYITTPFKTPIQYLYLWDANGREKIEVTDFKD